MITNPRAVFCFWYRTIRTSAPISLEELKTASPPVAAATASATASAAADTAQSKTTELAYDAADVITENGVRLIAGDEISFQIKLNRLFGKRHPTAIKLVRMAGERETGVISSLKTDNGYGFISRLTAVEPLFFHITQLLPASASLAPASNSGGPAPSAPSTDSKAPALAVGDCVSYTVIESTSGGGKKSSAASSAGGASVAVRLQLLPAGTVTVETVDQKTQFR